jgi:hypothetical protein
MPTRRACVLGAGVAGLAAAMRLCRSDWDVVLVESTSPAPNNRFAHPLRGIGYDAAARLGLLPRLIAASQPRGDKSPLLCPDDVAAALRESLGDVQTRRHVEVAGLAQDDCGVTVTFNDGSEDWFDLVVGADGAEWLPPGFWSDVDNARTWALRQIALLGEAICAAQLHESTSLAIGGAELLGDALDIFTDTAEALVWWEKHMRRTVRHHSAVPTARDQASTK